MKELEVAVRFHGHLCPMLYLGLRMGRFTLKEMGREKEKGVKLLAQVEFRNCLADGIQYACGTTYGKNNLFYKEYGKFAVTFHDLASNKIIRVRIRNKILEDTLDYGLRGKEVKSLPTAKREKEARELFQWGKRIVGELEEMKDEDLFIIAEGEPIRAAEEISLEYALCSECGEATLVEYLDGVKGKKVCRACSKLVRE